MGFFSFGNKKEEPKLSQEEQLKKREEELKEKELERKAKAIKITTLDIKEDYEILSVYSAGNMQDLTRYAAEIGGDFIIGFRIVPFPATASTICSTPNHEAPTTFDIRTYLYGTIVKLKNK